MPSSSRLLYYDLGMNADDEGVVEAFSVMRMTGATEDDLRVLISKGFVTVLNEELVTYILDWNQNNMIRKDRYQESFYHELLIRMRKNEEERGRMVNHVVNQWLTEDSIGKDSIGKSRENLIAPPSTEGDAVAKIPLNVNGTYHLIYQSDVDHYKELYPAVDVEQEIRSMVGWCEANPNYRKTKNGIRRFITNWLNKSQNRTRAYSKQKGDSLFYDTTGTT